MSSSAERDVVGGTARRPNERRSDGREWRLQEKVTALTAKMEGLADAILAGREAKLAAARESRKARRQDRDLTGTEEAAMLELAGTFGGAMELE